MASSPKGKTDRGQAWWWAPLIASVLLVAALLGLATTKAGSPARGEIPPDRFSSERAMAHVREIAKEPHPVGTPANDRVRDYILIQLRELGLNPQVQTARAETRWRGSRTNQWVRLVGVKNIIVKVKGYDSSGSVLIAGHYDSVASGPGAADDAHASASLIEMLRALSNRPQLKNDLIVIFTDGEEAGLAGAVAFVDQHPWADEVRRVVNFEARGVTGKPVMFEATHLDNKALSTYSESVPSPSTNSLAYEVYKTLPNDTDLTIFREMNAGTMGFGFIGDVFRYHTAGDSPANLDQGTLQYAGISALDLAVAFGSQDVTDVGGDPVRTFFAFGPFVIAYPNAFAIALTVLLVGTWIGAISLAKRRRGLRLSGLRRGFLFGLLSLLAAALVSVALLGLVRAVNPDVALLVRGGLIFAEGEPYGGNLIMAAVALAVASVTVSLLTRADRAPRRYTRQSGHDHVPAIEVALGAVGVWILLAVLLTIALPQGAFILVLPALMLVIGLTVWAMTRSSLSSRDDSAGAPDSPAALLVLIAGAAVATYMVAPMIQSLHEGMTLGMAVLPAVLTAMLVLLYAPLLAVVSRGWGRRALPIGLAVAALVALVAGSMESKFTPEKQRPDSLSYQVDRTGSEASAMWISFDRRPDSWNEPYLTKSPEKVKLGPDNPYSNTEVLTSQAPVVDLAPPIVEALPGHHESHHGMQGRKVLVRSARGARNIAVFMASGGIGTIRSADVRGVSIDGYPIGMRPLPPGVEGRSGYYFYLVGVPDEGVELLVDVDHGPGDPPLEMVISDSTYGLPPSLGVAPRPSDAMQARVADQTIVRSRAVV